MAYTITGESTWTKPPRAKQSSKTSKLKFTGIILGVSAFAALALWADSAAVKAQVPQKCDRGTIAVTVPRPHILGFLTEEGPAIRDIVASRIPDVPISAVVKANGLTGPMGNVAPVQGGVACLQTPTGATVAPAALELHTRAQRAAEAAYVPPSKVHFTDADVARLARAAGFPRRSLVRAAAVALAESGGNVHARCFNSGHGCGASPATAISVDRCLWQINGRAHPWADTPAIDAPMACAKGALRISKGGKNWGPWSTFKSGSYARFIKRARQAVASLS